MFQQSELEYPVRGITLWDGLEFHIATVDYSGTRERITVKPTVPRNYEVLLKGGILEERVRHTARVVIKDYGIRSGRLWVHGGEVQLTIPPWTSTTGTW